MRIAVNQDGERVFEDNVNILTIMANESYADFAKKLQTEIEAEQGIKFGVIEKGFFASLSVKAERRSFLSWTGTVRKTLYSLAAIPII